MNESGKMTEDEMAYVRGTLMIEYKDEKRDMSILAVIVIVGVTIILATIIELFIQWIYS